MRVVTVLVLVLLTTSVHAGIFGPSTYEECIIENMKGVQSDQAARQISRACRQQFPETASYAVRKNPFEDLIPKPTPQESSIFHAYAAAFGVSLAYAAAFLIGLIALIHGMKRFGREVKIPFVLLSIGYCAASMLLIVLMGEENISAGIATVTAFSLFSGVIFWIVSLVAWAAMGRNKSPQANQD